MEIIDLSLGLHDGMITYPTKAHHVFESSIQARIAIEGRETRKFTMGSHCGTHVDAPKHFIKDGLSIDDYDVNDLVGEALLIDLGVKEPKEIIKLTEFKAQVDQFPGVKRLVFRSLWSRFWNTSQYYQDWPYFDEESIDYIVKSNISLIGIDFPSPDSAYFGTDCSLDSPNHKKIFKNKIILTEYLTNLDKLSPGKFFLMVCPLKLISFDGAPARVLAHKI